MNLAFNDDDDDDVGMPTDELPLPLLGHDECGGAKACSDGIKREKRRDKLRIAAVDLGIIIAVSLY